METKKAMRHMDKPMNKALYDTMISCESKQYGNPNNPKFEIRKQAIAEFINNHGCDHVTISSLTNMGQTTHSIMLDTFVSEKWDNGEITIQLGPMPESWIASRKVKNDATEVYDKTKDCWVPYEEYYANDDEDDDDY